MSKRGTPEEDPWDGWEPGPILPASQWESPAERKARLHAEANEAEFQALVARMAADQAEAE